MKVLVTRPEPDASAFADRCIMAGLTPITAPLMRVSFHKKTIDTANIGALAFTSANGVRAFAEVSQRRDLAVFAVGSATGECAKTAGFPTVSVADGDLRGLASLIDQSRGNFDGAILHIAGQDRAGDIVRALKEHGLEARREVLYEARAANTLPEAAHDALVADPPVDWAVFFSPRTATLFMALTKKSGIEDCLRDIRAACLSQAVADVLAGTDWKSIEIAARRDADAVISTLTQHAR